MEVGGDERHLPVEIGHGVGHHASPRTGSPARRAAVRARRHGDALRLVGRVDLLVEAAEIFEIGREQPFHEPGVDRRHLAELHDHPRQDDDGEIGRVLLHARVAQRQDLVGRGGQPHHAVAVQHAGLVEVALGQRELDLGLERGRCEAIHLWLLLTRPLDAFVDELEQLDEDLVALAVEIAGVVFRRPGLGDDEARLVGAGLVDDDDLTFLRLSLIWPPTTSLCQSKSSVESVTPHFSVMLPYLVRPGSLRTCVGSVPSR